MKEFLDKPGLERFAEGLQRQIDEAEPDAITEEQIDELIDSELDESVTEDAIEQAVEAYMKEHPVKGDPFTYEDFTPEQLAALKGPKGDTFTYEDLTPEQVQELKGEPFEYEDFTPEQLEELKGPKGDTFTYDDLTPEQLEELKGEDGAPGVHVGSDDPPEDAQVWVNPDGAPTSTEDWEFEMTDGSTDTKTVVVLNSDEGTATGRLGILKVKTADGSWIEIPAIAGRGIKSVARTNGNGAAGTIDTYTITYTDNTTSTFSVYNGKDGTNGKTPQKGTDYYTEADKAEMVEAVKNAMVAETWEFELEDGSTVTKVVRIG